MEAEFQLKFVRQVAGIDDVGVRAIVGRLDVVVGKQIFHDLAQIRMLAGWP